MFSLAKHSFQNSRNKLQVPPPWKAYNSIPVVAGGLLLQNGLAGQPAGVWDAGAVAAAVGGGGPQVVRRFTARTTTIQTRKDYRLG